MPCISHQNTSITPSDYLGSTATSEKNCENPLNLPTSSQRPLHWMTHTFSQVEPNSVNEPKDISSDTSLSLPETMSLPLTPSITGQYHQLPSLQDFQVN